MHGRCPSCGRCSCCGKTTPPYVQPITHIQPPYPPFPNQTSPQPWSMPLTVPITGPGPVRVTYC